MELPQYSDFFLELVYHIDGCHSLQFLHSYILSPQSGSPHSTTSTLCIVMIGPSVVMLGCVFVYYYIINWYLWSHVTFTQFELEHDVLSWYVPTEWRCRGIMRIVPKVGMLGWIMATVATWSAFGWVLIGWCFIICTRAFWFLTRSTFDPKDYNTRMLIIWCFIFVHSASVEYGFFFTHHMYLFPRERLQVLYMLTQSNIVKRERWDEELRTWKEEVTIGCEISLRGAFVLSVGLGNGFFRMTGSDTLWGRRWNTINEGHNFCSGMSFFLSMTCLVLIIIGTQNRTM